MKNQILLNGDPCDICSRIKEIDENYFITFNLLENRFEVHSCEGGDTLCLCLPYGQLDERTLDKTRRTRKENADKMIEQMDRENELLRQRLKTQAIEQIREVIDENK